jgi:hypothetical protein
LWLPKAPTLRDFIVGDTTRCLLQIAHTDYSTSDEMTNAIRAATKEFDMMNTGDTTYKITRRDAMCELASVPMIALGQKQTLHSRRYEEVLRYCTAALEACWQLYRGSDPIGTQHAFDCVCTYVPLLETIAHDSVQYRKKALDLAARYGLLQTLLGWECAGRTTTISYARNAMGLSKATGDILLQLSACTKLNWTYVRGRNYTEAWETMQEGEYILKKYQRKKDGIPLPSGIIGNFYSSYCQAQIKNGIAPDYALGIATDGEPLKGDIAFVQFTASGQWWEAAWAYCAKGDPTQAMIWLEKLIDLETLAPHQGLRLTESERIGAINILTHALLQLQERDMGRIITAWTVAIKGAKGLDHEVMYEEAITNFEIMRVFWPNEQAIMKLVPLTARRSEEEEHKD